MALIVNGLPAADDRYEQPSKADVHAATSSKLARAFSSAPVRPGPRRAWVIVSCVIVNLSPISSLTYT